MELYHYGVPGMKWGMRRYQNADGSLTNAGKARYAKIKSDIDKAGERFNKTHPNIFEPYKPSIIRDLKREKASADLDRGRKKKADFIKNLDIDAYAKFKIGKDRIDQILKDEKVTTKKYFDLFESNGRDGYAADNAYETYIESNPKMKAAHDRIYNFLTEHENDDIAVAWFDKINGEISAEEYKRRFD